MRWCDQGKTTNKMCLFWQIKLCLRRKTDGSARLRGVTFDYCSRGINILNKTKIGGVLLITN